MEKIKFRAWDKECKELYNVNHVQNLRDGEKFIKVWTSDVENGRLFSPDGLEQFIGLVDGRGVPIYEGDIVFYRDYEFSFIAKVVKGSYYFYMKNNEDSYVFEDFADDNTGEVAALTVIGNIHENSDLLEVD